MRLRAPALALLLTCPPGFAAAAPAPRKPAAAAKIAPKPAALAVGDGIVVTLKNGNEIKGLYQGRDTAVWVEVDGGQIGIDPDTILSMTGANTAEAEFNRRKARLKEKDAEGWWSLSQWAASQGLEANAKSAAETVVAISPEHSPARRFLGYQYLNGEWHETNDMKIARGLVLHNGRWIREDDLDDVLEEEHREAKRARSLESLKQDRTVYLQPVEAKPK